MQIGHLCSACQQAARAHGLGDATVGALARALDVVGPLQDDLVYALTGVPKSSPQLTDLVAKSTTAALDALWAPTTLVSAMSDDTVNFGNTPLGVGIASILAAVSAGIGLVKGAVDLGFGIDERIKRQNAVDLAAKQAALNPGGAYANSLLGRSLNQAGQNASIERTVASIVQKMLQGNNAHVPEANRPFGADPFDAGNNLSTHVDRSVAAPLLSADPHLQSVTVSDMDNFQLGSATHYAAGGPGLGDILSHADTVARPVSLMTADASAYLASDWRGEPDAFNMSSDDEP